MESIDILLKDINTPTEERQVQSVIEPIVEAEPLKPEPVPAAAEVKEEPKAEEKKTEPLTKEMLSNSADLVIGMTDFTQHNIYRALGNRKKKRVLKERFGNDALSKLEKLINELDAFQEDKTGVSVIPNYTADEVGMLRLEKAVQEYMEDLPMSDREKEAIKIPLMEIMKKRGGTIPPEIALMLAAVQIFGARTAELIML